MVVLSFYICLFFLVFFFVYLKNFYCMPDIDGKRIETEVNIIYIQKRMCLFYRPSEWVVESVYLGIELGFALFLLSFPLVHHRLQIPLSLRCCYLVLSVGIGVFGALSQFSSFTLSFQ